MCLVENIGLKGCDETVYPYYINDLFNITNANLADLAEEETLDASGVFEKSKTRSYINFLNDIEKYLSKYTFHGIVDTVNIGDYGDGEELPSNTNERGVKVVLRNKCKEAGYYLTSLNVTSTTETLIYVDGVLLEDYEIPFKVEGKEIKIVTTGNVNDTLNYCCNQKCPCICVNNKYMQVYGVDGSTNTDKTYGVMASIEARCSLDDFICKFNNERIFNYTFAQRVYIDLLELSLKRERYSPFVVNNREFVEGELSRLVHGYVLGEGVKQIHKQGEYFSNIGLLVNRIEKAIEKGNCKCCFGNKLAYSKSY